MKPEKSETLRKKAEKALQVWEQTEATLRDLPIPQGKSKTASYDSQRTR